MLKALVAGLLLLGFTPSHAQLSSYFKNGTWRALLHRQDGNDIVFNFEVKDSLGKKVLLVKNAGERIYVDEISGSGDSVFIKMPFFDSQIRAAANAKGQLQGVWIKRLADRDQVMPFTAYYNQSFRFDASKPASHFTASGRWAVNFWVDGKTDTTAAVGEFQQQGKNLAGTFLSTTGDYRYLQGVVNGDSIRLSCFDGGHAYLFTAVFKNGKLLEGKYYSGPAHAENWTAHKDTRASLPDEFSITRLKKGQDRLDFSFRSIDGQQVSLKDDRFKNKVVILQIMGSWCPNCMDETRFLSNFYKKYHDKGVEIIGLAYERSTDFERAQKNLGSFQKRFGVQYPVLFTGVTVDDPQRAEKTLPQLEKIEGFPTTIFIGRSGVVEKIHTGFNGPATGGHYAEEQQTFEKLVQQLLSE